MGRNTRFATIVSSFMDRLGLVPVWSHFPVDYTHITVAPKDQFGLKGKPPSDNT